MTIDPTTTTPLSTATPVSAGVNTPQSQVLGKDAFMQLLITKMQNQDPTQPQDDAALLAQLAQFSTLEQMQQMNTTLTGISDFFTQAKTPAVPATSTAMPATTPTTTA
jgi:flagellar basal-body rod modification protein FlgD